MNFALKIFKEVMDAKYTQLEEESASFAYKVEGDTLRIYFEWSRGITDWKNNFDFPAKPYRDMKNKWFCHRGFLRVWKTIEPHLKDQIMNPELKHIRIAGYSHGAALALLCHEYCKFNRPECIVYGYGFGSPRVIWGFLRKSVKERFAGFTTVRNKGDIVTHLPPVILGFRHCPLGVWTIGTDSHYNCIEAHRPESYITELGDLLR